MLDYETRAAVMVTRVYFGFIFVTNSSRIWPFWLKMLIREHYFWVNSCEIQKLFVPSPPS